MSGRWGGVYVKMFTGRRDEGEGERASSKKNKMMKILFVVC